MALSEPQVAQYRRDGYVCPVPVMPAAEALALRRQLEAVEALRLLALSHEDTYDEDNMLTRGQSIRGLNESQAAFMPLRSGEMSLHNYCLAHGSGPNLSSDRRIGVSMHFMPPQTRQVVGSWDCAALVRGTDRYGHFEPTPIPARDFDPAAVSFHARAAAAMRDVLYAGAARKLQRL